MSFASYRALEDGGNPCYVVGASQYDQGLHVAAIFILFIASALGVVVPLVPKYSRNFREYPYLIILGKCAGTGVMLSCSLVHMILPSTEALTSECLPALFNTAYPAFSFAFALLAALGSHLTEFLLFASITGSQGAGRTENADEDSKGIDVDVTEDQSIKKNGWEKSDLLNVQDPLRDQEQLVKAKHLTEALLAEFSLSMHSVFVGVALGVSDNSTVVALLIALIFHQLLEGVALGCRLADSTIGPWTVTLFAAIFSVSCSVGIIIGIGVYRTFNSNGEAFLLVQGIFDGISGGLLLYNGFQLLLVDFHEDLKLHCRGDRRNLMIIGMFAALWTSACAMSLIGAWA
jgi:zinc transporter 1/2/3